MESINFQDVNKATVYVRDHIAGYLEKKGESEYILKYAEEYLKDPNHPAISNSLPKQTQVFRSKTLHPFFDNLIAEGWLLQHTEKIFHIDKKNRFALLMATGGETIGAVTVIPISPTETEIDLDQYFKDRPNDHLKKYEANPALFPNFCSYCMKAIKIKERFHKTCANRMWGTTKSLKISLDENSPISSFTAVIYGGSISGAQKKGMFSLEKSNGILKSIAKGSEFILKPNGYFPELPENEHITMSIAKRAGFDTPPFVLLTVEGLGNVFAIKRFDRNRKNKVLLKYLQEDMGQIIGTHSSNKYNSSCEKVAASIRKSSSSPVVDLVKFFERLIFCFITANADMHLKNWSMLELPSMLNIYGLSPVYDLVNTRLAIPNEEVDIGIPIRGKDRNLQASYFIKFAKEIGIEKRIVEDILSKAETWKDIAEPLIAGSLLKESSKERYVQLLNQRHEILFS